LLFNIYIEKAINEYKGYCTGIKLNGTRIQMLKFADYIAIVAQDELKKKKKIMKLRCHYKKNYEMKIKRNEHKLQFSPKILKILILKLMTTL